MEERFVNNEKVTGSIPVHGDEENYSLNYFFKGKIIACPFHKAYKYWNCGFNSLNRWG